MRDTSGIYSSSVACSNWWASSLLRYAHPTGNSFSHRAYAWALETAVCFARRWLPCRPISAPSAGWPSVSRRAGVRPAVSSSRPWRSSCCQPSGSDGPSGRLGLCRFSALLWRVWVSRRGFHLGRLALWWSGRHLKN